MSLDGRDDGLVELHAWRTHRPAGLGREVAAEGIRVNAVRPGIIDTEIHDSSGIPGRVKMMRDVIPMKREGTAEEVADAIVWLTSDQSTYVTGTIVTVAGGRC